MRIRCDERTVPYDYSRFTLTRTGETREVPMSDLWVYTRDGSQAYLFVQAICGD